MSNRLIQQRGFPLCRPRKPLRCWQHHAKDDNQPIPVWAAAALDIDGDEVKHEEWVFDEGDWLVEFEGGEDPLFGVYSDAQFAAAFDIIPSDDSARTEGETRE